MSLYAELQKSCTFGHLEFSIKNMYEPVRLKWAIEGAPELNELSGRQGVVEVRLKDLHENLIVFSFDNHLAYRKLDEGDALVALAQLHATAQSGLLLYEVRNSDFIEWLSLKVT